MDKVMILLLEISILFLIFIIAFRNLELIISLGIAMLPFQQAFTINLFGTLRLSDIFFIVAFQVIILKLITKKIEPYFKLNKEPLYFIFLIINSIILYFVYKSKINYGMVGIINYNKYKWLTNIFTPTVALICLFVGGYIGTLKLNIIKKMFNIWSITTIITSMYTIFQFIFLNTLGIWFKLPGEVLDYATSFAFGLRRAWGFSIEPGAFSNYMVFSLLIFIIFINFIKYKKITIIMTTISIICSFSTVGLISIFVILFSQFMFNKKISTKNKLILIAITIIFIIVIINNKYFFDAIVNKVSFNSTSQSTIDRKNNVEILFRIFKTHSNFGVGFGNYGAFRNYYAYDFREFYDIPNMFYFGVLAEQGLVGTIVLIYFFILIFKNIRLSQNSDLMVMIPFFILMIPASTITADYMGIGFGVVLSIFKNYKSVNKKILKNKWECIRYGMLKK